MMAQIPPRNDESPCVVLCNGQYSEILGFKKADELAQYYAMRGQRSYVFRLIQETMYGGNK
jgi:hypothetical protein